jgi:hypothetical protein
LIKSKIIEIHEKWESLGESIDCYKYGEIHESYVIEIISEYCVAKGYEVDGFPFHNKTFSSDVSASSSNYFCHERYIKYLDILALQKEDVFELMYFYSSTFWLEQFYDKEQYRGVLQDYIDCDVYEIAF